MTANRDGHNRHRLAPRQGARRCGCPRCTAAPAGRRPRNVPVGRACAARCRGLRRRGGTPRPRPRPSGSLQPDVVLLDVRLPDVDGISVSGELAALSQSPAGVLMSSRAAAGYGDRLREAPVLGVVAKSQLSGALLREVLSGQPCWTSTRRWGMDHATRAVPPAPSSHQVAACSLTVGFPSTAQSRVAEDASCSTDRWWSVSPASRVAVGRDDVDLR